MTHDKGAHQGKLIAAIFDVDGVLLASPHERAWREALQGLADPVLFTTALYQDHVAGKPRASGARAALEALGVRDIDRQTALNLRLAEAVTQAAINHAEHLGIAVSVAVCQAEGRIVAFQKMDGTDVMSGHEAMRRAITAAGGAAPSQSSEAAMNGCFSTAIEGIGLSRQPGGLPFLSSEGCFGGVGVCGGTAEQSVACARAGVENIMQPSLAKECV